MKATRWMGMVLVVLLAYAGSAAAGSSDRLGTDGAPELRLPVGARSIALAGSNLGNVSGAEALWYNPAGIAEATAHTEVLFSHTDYIADMKLNYFAVTQAVGDLGTIGVSAKVFSIGDIAYTTESAPEGTGEVFSPTFSTLGVSFARKMTDRVDFGATISYVSERILQETAAGMAFDFGFQYDTDLHGLRLGMAMRNVGPSMEFHGSDFERLQHVQGDDPQAFPRSLGLSSAQFELPTTFQFGLSFPMMRSPEASLTIHGLYMSNSFAVDEGRVGAELTVRKDFALRAGYKVTSNKDDLFGFSYGAGVRVPLGGAHLWVDYAGQTVSSFFSDVQHVSATFQF